MRYLLPIFALVPGMALAHPHHHHHHHHEAGFAEGLAHPLLGLDHLIAMLAIGVVAALMGGRARWAVPAAFLGGMLVFGLLGVGRAESDLAEHVIIASIIVLGGVMALSMRAPLVLVAAAAVVFGAAHGYAHGSEGTGDPGYLAGFMLSTAALHAAGIAVGLWIAGRAAVVPRALGGVIALSGVVLAFG